MIETKRLFLRTRTRDQLKEIEQAPLVEQLEFFGLDTEEELDDTWTRVNRGLSNHSIGFRLFDLIEKDTNKVIGNCGFHTWIHEHDRAELGYGLHDDYKGKGFMSEALEAILQYGFEEMGLNRAEALISPKNTPSINLVTKFGFIKEGIIRNHYFIDNVYEDSISYSLLKSEYKATQEY
jgi:ribosomal-protein-alanine N-acetyltransferase